MAHHGDAFPKGLGAEFQEFTEKLRREGKSLFGATGEFPQGYFAPEDEGEIRFGITVAKGKLILAFGKEVAWVGFGADQAREVAETLLERACEIDGVEAHVRRTKN